MVMATTDGGDGDGNSNIAIGNDVANREKQALHPNVASQDA